MKIEPVTVPLKRIGDLVPNGWCQAHKKTWYLMDVAKHSQQIKLYN